MIFNSYFYVVFIGIISAFLLFIDKKLPGRLKLASLSLIAPLFFNILAFSNGCFTTKTITYKANRAKQEHKLQNKVDTQLII